MTTLLYHIRLLNCFKCKFFSFLKNRNFVGPWCSHPQMKCGYNTEKKLKDPSFNCQATQGFNLVERVKKNKALEFYKMFINYENESVD